MDCSYGFRPGRGAHDAIRALDRSVHQGKVSWILEADIVSFFDSLDRTKLEGDARDSGGRWVAEAAHREVLCMWAYWTGVELSTSSPSGEPPQGSVTLAAVGDLYLHYTLDVWFEREVKPRLRGPGNPGPLLPMTFVIGFERREDAQRVMEVLGKRMGRFGLTLHPDKTRLHPVPASAEAGQRGGKGPGDLRLSRVHDVLGDGPVKRTLADVVQDAVQEPETVQSSRLRLVPAPSGPTGRRSSTQALKRRMVKDTSTTSVSAATFISLLSGHRAR